MELILDANKFSYFEKNDNNLIVGYNFYDVLGRFLGFHEKNQDYYPRAGCRILIQIEGKKIEMKNDESLYKTENGEYFLGRKI